MTDIQLNIRRANTDDDIKKINSLIKEKKAEVQSIFGNDSIITVIEHSYLSVVAITNDDDIVAFSAFRNEPNNRYTDEFVDWFDSNYAYPEFEVFFYFCLGICNYLDDLFCCC